MSEARVDRRRRKPKARQRRRKLPSRVITADDFKFDGWATLKLPSLEEIHMRLIHPVRLEPVDRVIANANGDHASIHTADRLRDVRDAALRPHRGGLGYYRGSDFVQVDVGRVRQWQSFPDTSSVSRPDSIGPFQHPAHLWTSKLFDRSFILGARMA